MSNLSEAVLWNLLLIDDDEDDYLLTRGLLAEARPGKFKLEWTSTYEAGLQALLGQSYDAVLLDYDLGPKNGLGLIREALAAGVQTPIILFTGRGSYEVDMEAIQAGASLYLTKGETSALMLERGIRYAMERQRAAQALSEANRLLRHQAQEMEKKNRQLQQANQRLQETLKAQRESEERFRALFNGITEGFALHEIVLDQDGRPCDYRFLEINPSFERLTGLTRRQVIGQLKNEVLPEDDPYWLEVYGQVALTGEPVHFENYSPALKQHYEVYAYRPAPLQFAVLFMNITERKRMEAELRVNLTKYQALFEAFPLGITVSDQEGRIIEANAEAERLLGISTAEHMRRTIDDTDWQIIRPDGSPMPAEEYASVQALHENRRVENVEMGIVRPEGEVTWISATASPIPLEGYGVLVTYNDITARIQAETGRRQSEQELLGALHNLEASRRQIAQILESIQDGFFVLDRDWRFAYINQRAADNVGYQPQDLIGQAIWELFPQMAGSQMEAVYRRCMDTGKAEAFEVQGILSPRWYEVAAYPFAEGLAIYWRDKTEQKQAALALADHTRRLELRNRDMQAITQAVTRDLQAPLHELEAAMARLSESLPAGSAELSAMHRSAGRMDKIMDDMLAYARLIAAEQPFSAVDLTATARRALQDLHAQVEATGARVELGDLPTLLADPGQMQELFRQLIGNSLKFHRPGTPPQIQISASRPDSTTVEITIADNGIGFDMQDAGDLFAPFRRLVGDDEYEGSGLGLPVCQRIVTRHSGSISFASQPGQGSSFTVTLPVGPS